MENPEGYKNVLLHMKMHKDAAMQQMMMSMPPPPPAGEKGESPNKKPKEGPVKEENNAPVQ
jgi:hypothetical protein